MTCLGVIELKELNSDEFIISYSSIPDSAYIKIIWKEFFESRSRGLTLERHFPWLTDKKNVFVSVNYKGAVIGGLVMRQLSKVDVKNNIILNLSLIGLVCIKEEFRGLGLSTLLLENSIEKARKMKIDHLVLWSSKHAVYEKLNFKILDFSQYGQLKNLPKVELLKDEMIVKGYPEELPMPVFATTGGSIHYRTSSVIYTCDHEKYNVISYEGELNDIWKILCTLNSKKLYINVDVRDELYRYLNEKNCQANLEKSNLQMSHCLNTDTQLENIKLSVLDRI